MRKIICTALLCAMICPLASCGEKPASAGSSAAVSEASQTASETETSPAETETSTEEPTQQAPAETAPPETTEAPSAEEPAESAPSEAEETPSESGFTGKWECTALTIDGETYEGEYMGVPLYAILALELSSDGSAKAISPMAGSETDAEWTAEADEIVIGEGDEQLKASLSGDILHMTSEDDATSYDFERVDEFTEFDYDQWFENYDYKKYSAEQS